MGKQWRRLLSVICLVAAVTVFVGCQTQQIPATQEPTQAKDYGTREWNPTYNDHLCGIQASWADRQCAFEEDLSQEQISLITPGKKLPWMSYTGHGYFKEDGSTLRVLLRLETQSGKKISIVIGSDASYYGCCISREPDAVKSACGDVVYTLYHRAGNVEETLLAEATIGGQPILIRMRADNFKQDKQFFEDVLECFSWYDSEEPIISKIVPAQMAS